MSTGTFKIVFSGQTVGGYHVDAVRSNLRRRFKLTAEQLDAFFSGNETVVEDGLSRESAQELQAALVRDGAVSILHNNLDPSAQSDREYRQDWFKPAHEFILDVVTLWRRCVKKFPAVHRLTRWPLPKDSRKSVTGFFRRCFRNLPRFGFNRRRITTATVFVTLVLVVFGIGAIWPYDMQWMVFRAKQGGPSAQYQLGLRYKEGKGVPQDDEQAVSWFQMAAEQGYAPGQNDLGILYESGRGVPKDDRQAVVWYRKAAEQGHMWAQNNLGVMYETDRGVPHNDPQAAAWYRKAAKQGHMWAQNNLGVMYQAGRGVPQNNTQAAAWYREAATQGHTWAQTNLGFMYQQGWGVPKNYEQANTWYRKAATQGHKVAQERLEYLTAVPIIGRWVCESRNPSGKLTSETLGFSDNGEFGMMANGVTFSGSYKYRRPNVDILITMKGANPPVQTRQKISGKILEVNHKLLRLETSEPSGAVRVRDCFPY